jgi:hypothetical protein
MALRSFKAAFDLQIQHKIITNESLYCSLAYCFAIKDQTTADTILNLSVEFKSTIKDTYLLSFLDLFLKGIINPNESSMLNTSFQQLEDDLSSDPNLAKPIRNEYLFILSLYKRYCSK